MYNYSLQQCIPSILKEKIQIQKSFCIRKKETQSAQRYQIRKVHNAVLKCKRTFSTRYILILSPRSGKLIMVISFQLEFIESFKKKHNHRFYRIQYVKYSFFCMSGISFPPADWIKVFLQYLFSDVIIYLFISPLSSVFMYINIWAFL